MEVGKLHEKNHLHRNKMKHVKKMISTPKRGLFPKQSNAINISMSRRRTGEKNKFHQSLKTIAFNPDPLNLSAICNRKEGTDSPETASPIVDRSHHFEPNIVHSLDVNDPLNLNHVDDESLIRHVRKRKKRKRRSTLTDTEEFMSILNNGIANDPLTKSEPLLLAEEAIPKESETSELNIVENKIEKCIDNNEPDNNVEKNIHKLNKICNYNQPLQVHFTEKNKRYRYGNYIDCNDGLRKNVIDQRLNFFRKEWFEGKQCLDIGCNTGKVTTLIAKHFMPLRIVGVDIDSNLIKIAKRKAKEFVMVNNKHVSKYPMSFHLTYGPILGVQLANKGHEFPDNLSFHVENCVPASSELLHLVKSEFECILCLNVTKWIHLNFGDSGLKLFFKRLFKLLKPGGRLLLEPQNYNSYKKKKKMTPETWKHFTEMKLMPTDFVSYLLSGEVGFARSECLTHSRKGKAGFDRPVYLLEKSDSK